jgi:hypothetical protein
MDGNCLFHAAVRELKRLHVADVPDARALRTRLINWVAAHGDSAAEAAMPPAAAPASAPPSARPSSRGVKAPRCDKCDGKHETDACPYFQKAREESTAPPTLAEWIALETDEKLEAYVRRLHRDGEWGGIIELYALTEVFGVRTCVWEPLGRDARGRPTFTLRHSIERNSSSGTAAGRDTSPRVIHLHYNGSSHYSVFAPDDSNAAAHMADDTKAQLAPKCEACETTAGAAAAASNNSGIRNDSSSSSSSSGGGGGDIGASTRAAATVVGGRNGSESATATRRLGVKSARGLVGREDTSLLPPTSANRAVPTGGQLHRLSRAGASQHTTRRTRLSSSSSHRLVGGRSQRAVAHTSTLAAKRPLSDHLVSKLSSFRGGLDRLPHRPREVRV